VAGVWGRANPQVLLAWLCGLRFDAPLAEQLWRRWLNVGVGLRQPRALARLPTTSPAVRPQRAGWNQVPMFPETVPTESDRSINRHRAHVGWPFRDRTPVSSAARTGSESVSPATLIIIVLLCGPGPRGERRVMVVLASPTIQRAPESGPPSHARPAGLPGVCDRQWLPSDRCSPWGACASCS
jgi:hypothetical protein